MSEIPANTQPSTSSTNSPEVQDGKLVKRRSISSPGQAQALCDALVYADAGRDARRAEIQRAINGAAPYNERTLREKNQGHRFNVSFGYLEGACGRAYAPYLDLGLDEEFVAKINAPNLDETKKNIIREKFVKYVRKWGMWPCYYNALVNEVVDFGYCTAVFPSPHSPWWHPAKQREGLTFDRARNVAAKLDFFCWRRSYLIHELYEHVEDKKAAEAAGWKLENVWNALSNAAPDDYTRNTNVMGGREIYEQAVRAAAFYLSYGQGAKVINTYHAFSREMSGRVSHWIILDTSASGTKPDMNDLSGGICLFYQFEEFESFDHLVVRFDMEFGDGTWHGSKGLAQKLYGVHKAHDRLMNSGLDQTFRGGLGILKSLSQKGHESFNIQVTSDFVVLSPDYDAIQGVSMPTLRPEFFSMDAALLATAVQRGGDVAPEAMGVDRPEKTATQSNIDQSQKQVVTKANLKRWVPSLSKVIDTMLMRLLDTKNGGRTAQEFVKELLEAGITEEEIREIKRVEVLHTVEDVFGETRQAISYISDKYRGDPDADRLELKKKEVGIWLGPQASLELIPGDADQLSQLNASRLQTMEISAILDGMDIPVAPNDLHPVHIATGINWINDVSKRLVMGQYKSHQAQPEGQDVQNVAAHLNQHVQMFASVKGQRQAARELEAQLQMAVEGHQKATQVNLQKHVQAMESGLEAGLRDASSASPPSSGVTAPATSSPARTPLPEMGIPGSETVAA